jgi:predicted DCC family thiol-disulfide oxidoreductase YuxK
MNARPVSDRRGVILYDGTCGFCSWFVPYWAPTLRRAGFDTAPLQSAEFSGAVNLDAPESWDLTLLLRDGRTLLGPDAYREVMRHIPWAYPFYLLSITPGLRRLFNLAYGKFAQNRYCVSRVLRRVT